MLAESIDKTRNSSDMVVSPLLLGLLLLKSLTPTASAQTTPSSVILPAPRTGPNKFQAYLVGSFVTQTDLFVHYEIAKPALELAVVEANRRYPSINFNLNVGMSV